MRESRVEIATENEGMRKMQIHELTQLNYDYCSKNSM